MLSQVESLLLSVEPLDVNRSVCSRNHSIFQFLDRILSFAKRGKLDKWWSSESTSFSDEFNIKYFAKLLKELPDILLIPCNRQVANIDNELDLLRFDIILGGIWRFRPLFPFFAIFTFFFLLNFLIFVRIHSTEI